MVKSCEPECATFTGANQMTATSEILSMDDRVDSLTDQQVKDAWTRGQFMYQIIRANGPRFMCCDTCDSVEQVLSEMTNAGLKRASIEGLGREHPVTQSLGWEDGPGNIETLFERLTSEEPDMDDVRSDLKSALRGSGMPRINVMRARVQTHSE